MELIIHCLFLKGEKQGFCNFIDVPCSPPTWGGGSVPCCHPRGNEGNVFVIDYTTISTVKRQQDVSEISQLIAHVFTFSFQQFSQQLLANSLVNLHNSKTNVSFFGATDSFIQNQTKRLDNTA